MHRVVTESHAFEDCEALSADGLERTWIRRPCRPRSLVNASGLGW